MTKFAEIMSKNQLAPHDCSSQQRKKEKLWKMYDSYKQVAFPKAPEISVSELAQKMKNGDEIVLVDARTKEEQEVSIIPGAIPKQDFERRKVELQNQTVVCYCTIGYRSGTYVQQLVNQGVNAYNLQGSLLAWVHNNEKVIDQQSGEEVKKIHVFGSKWALQPDEYEYVAFRSPLLKIFGTFVGRIFLSR
eukprot:TRINITY_DN1617_c0_g2_i1.p2 TRINITY_DN1617_c0_g2~~TRINITY_DN1617_c0_g2_i1.p2  ORF type:complete len:190 (-),score=23.47 TRINITY_DN1617_c0_g2_i1:244-813(-)